jgi:hypothetical protein
VVGPNGMCALGAQSREPARSSRPTHHNDGAERGEAIQKLSADPRLTASNHRSDLFRFLDFFGIFCPAKGG